MYRRRDETHIEVMLGIVKSEIKGHISLIDMNIDKLYNILMCNLPKQLHQSKIISIVKTK